MKLFLKHYYIMTNDSNIDFEMNSTPNPLEKILFLITAAIILDKCFITVVLYPLATWREHPKPIKVGDIYKCVDCDEEFKTIMGAQIHKQTVHDKIRYDCHLCEKQFSQQSNLKTHIENHHQQMRKYKCDTCDYCFKDNRGLKRHIKNVHILKLWDSINMHRSKAWMKVEKKELEPLVKKMKDFHFHFSLI